MNKKVLVIDDDESCRDVLQEALSYFGFEVITDDGRTNVINLIKSCSPDILVIDYILDGVNGGEWCSRIKKDPTQNTLPVIIISAHNRVINSLGHYGCDSFMAKPFELDHLLSKINELTCFVEN